jgi:hypothetical protein
MMAPHAEAKVVRGLVLSGQVFADFDEDERTAIWESLKSFKGLIPSLYSFFEDFKCFESWAHCLERLSTLKKPTVRSTMESLQKYSEDSDDVCLIQTSDTTEHVEQLVFIHINSRALMKPVRTQECIEEVESHII